jgi:hypothetical protein
VTFLRYLQLHSACAGAKIFAKGLTYEQAWNTAPDAAWLFWLASEVAFYDYFRDKPWGLPAAERLAAEKAAEQRTDAIWLAWQLTEHMEPAAGANAFREMITRPKIFELGE